MSDDEEKKKKKEKEKLKKEKKKEKKEKKRKEREEEKEKSKKSKKKNKVVKEEEDKEGETTTNAKIVGDFGLAKSGAPFQKKFYEPSESILRLSEKDVKERRDSLAITIENDGKKNGIYNFTPLATFQEAGFPKEILAVCKNFQKPSPIQAQSWPIIMSGHDMVGIAATGSGKTLAFGLPALIQIKAQPPCKPGQPACLVLAPTRELAQQTAKVFDDAGDATGIKCVCVYGGGPKYLQKQEMKQMRTELNYIIK